MSASLLNSNLGGGGGDSAAGNNAIGGACVALCRHSGNEVACVIGEGASLLGGAERTLGGLELDFLGWGHRCSVWVTHTD